MRVVGLLLLLALLTGCGGGQEQVSVFGLQVGDCFDDPQAGQAGEVPIVECGEPHDNEVFALVNHPAGPGEPFPGRDAVVALAEEACPVEFESYVGRAYEQSRLYVVPLVPSEASWDEGDRTIVCALYEGDGGKMRDSRRGSGV